MSDAAPGAGPAEEPASSRTADQPAPGDSADQPPGAAVSDEDLTWRLVGLVAVRMDLPSPYPVVVLHEQSRPWRQLEIPVAFADGTAIAAAWRAEPTPRPLTHQVWLDMLERHNVQIAAVRITARRGGVFFAELDTMGPRGRQVVACRPSDALALVLRARPPVPVLVADWVFAPRAG